MNVVNQLLWRSQAVSSQSGSNVPMSPIEQTQQPLNNGIVTEDNEDDGEVIEEDDGDEDNGEEQGGQEQEEQTKDESGGEIVSNEAEAASNLNAQETVDNIKASEASHTVNSPQGEIKRIRIVTNREGLPLRIDSFLC